jgi:hypothetical protein
MGSGCVAAACVLGLHLAACGGDAKECPGWSATVDGTIEGRGFEPVDALGYVKNRTGGSIGVLSVTMTDRARSQSLVNSAALQIFVIDASGEVATVGTYPIASGAPGTDDAVATFVRTDGACVGRSIQASSGSLALTRVDAIAITGTFSLTMETGDELRGSFLAPLCTMGSGEEEAGECRPP